MNRLHYTLLADGSTDDALLPVLTFLLRANGVLAPIEPAFANLRNFPKPPKDLTERVVESLRLNSTNNLNEADLLFVHRDAERSEWQFRKDEITVALDKAKSSAASTKGSSKSAKSIVIPPAVGVIPVRMTEAWLLSNEAAIRRAAGNPNGRMLLAIPRLQNREQIPDPKEVLYDLLRTASGLRGRRLKQFSTSGSARRVAELTDDFSALRGIPAFDALEAEIKAVVEAQNWHPRAIKQTRLPLFNPRTFPPRLAYQ